MNKKAAADPPKSALGAKNCPPICVLTGLLAM
jgi:hypothetical protein